MACKNKTNVHLHVFQFQYPLPTDHVLQVVQPLCPADMPLWG